MKVLIAVDGSAGSFEAVSQVGGLLTPDHDQVALYYSPPEVRLSATSAGADLRARARRALAQGVLDESCSKLPAGMQAGAHSIEGTQDARHGIAVAAEQWHADLIVVGARGLSQFERLLLGSVSRSVAHAVRIPVWVARPRQTPAGEGFHVVLACECPKSGRPAAGLLGKLTWPQGATCQVMTVISSFYAGEVPDWLLQQARSADVEAFAQKWAREHDEALRNNLASMRDFGRSLPAGLQLSEPLVAEGDPAEQILAAIGREKTDLVVVGVKRKHSFAEAIFGSTSEAVLNHASCSVLLVPHIETP